MNSPLQNPLYLHCIDLDEWYPCWNLALCGKLMSPEYVAAVDAGVAAVQTHWRDAPIENLRNKPGSLTGVLTPRGISMLMAAMLRKGMMIGIGVPDTKWITKPGTLERILTIADIELAFEEGRRSILPEGASRLSSLYLAENSDDGRMLISKMFSHRRARPLIIPVNIDVCLRLTKVDSDWIGAYGHENKPEFIENYWKGIPYNEKTSYAWEYLLDGMISVNDPTIIEQIKAEGAKL